jgi:hypothetical protein
MMTLAVQSNDKPVQLSICTIKPPIPRAQRTHAQQELLRLVSLYDDILRSCFCEYTHNEHKSSSSTWPASLAPLERRTKLEIVSKVFQGPICSRINIIIQIKHTTPSFGVVFRGFRERQKKEKKRLVLSPKQRKGELRFTVL